MNISTPALLTAQVLSYTKVASSSTSSLTGSADFAKIDAQYPH